MGVYHVSPFVRHDDVVSVPVAEGSRNRQGGTLTDGCKECRGGEGLKLARQLEHAANHLGLGILGALGNHSRFPQHVA